MSTDDIPAEVSEYLASLDGDRGEATRAVFEVVAGAMPSGYQLGIQWGMPGWVVPLKRYPGTYNGQPLAYVSIAAQKNYSSLYLMCLYAGTDDDVAFRTAWAAGGRKLNMGKSCLRFTRLDDVDLDLVAEVVAAHPVEEFIATYERSRN